ncbi:Oxidoreductase [Fusarium torreyae]|uniref:Mitochondrial intermembrane space import and assembly protein 40 n=1 Tax=Fusarium torreyae TaxID=1237075 RepID=A0A9W8RY13_9HYPO|nr:Oxidoreductase [Fusarium torreyae]
MAELRSTGGILDCHPQPDSAPALSDDDHFAIDSSIKKKNPSGESSNMHISKDRGLIGPHESPANARDAMMKDDHETPEEKDPSQQGAYNPETGEFNWDCPCLGGMAHGPCGEEFKAAFRCFTLSAEEPRGIECIDKFQYVGFWEA